MRLTANTQTTLIKRAAVGVLESPHRSTWATRSRSAAGPSPSEQWPETSASSQQPAGSGGPDLRIAASDRQTARSTLAVQRCLQPLPLRFGLVAILRQLARARRSCDAARLDESTIRAIVVARHAIALARTLIRALLDGTIGQQPCVLGL